MTRSWQRSFNAEGIIGPTNVGGHQLSACDVITQLVNGQWQRVFPQPRHAR